MTDGLSVAQVTFAPMTCPDWLTVELDRLGPTRIRTVAREAHRGAADGVGPSLLLAIMSRETNCTNIVGDGGHGRGCMQIDDRSHSVWLWAHAGCPTGSWEPTRFKRAGQAGYCPTLTASLRKAVALLRANQTFAANNGVKRPVWIKFAVSAYNAGAGGALSGYRAGDTDRYTTGRNYAMDVLLRKQWIDSYLRAKGLPH